MTDVMTAPAEARRIPLYGPDGFEGMRAAGRLAAQTLDHVTPMVAPGVTTQAIDDAAREFILANGGVPACLGYRGYPKTVCTSVNHVICHGIPAPKPLRDGDIVNIDVTVVLDGWHGDTSRMWFVGKPKRKAERLVEVTYESMWAGINAVKPGATLGDIGYACQSVAEDARFSVVTDFCGHGIGRTFHAAPNVLHYGVPGDGVELRPGMFFTIEPMVNVGRPDHRILADNWTAVTRDKSLSAQFEHTVGVTEDGVEVFTRSLKGWDRPPYVV